MDTTSTTSGAATKLSRGDQTRQRIVAQAARVFSRQGYFGTPLSDLMRETGLEKGGIYNHFASKEALALEAFDYSIALLRDIYAREVNATTNSVDRLLAVLAMFRVLATNPPLPGGCPLLNTAIEADDAQPALRARVRRAMDEWLDLLRVTTQQGIARGEIDPAIDPDALATLLIASLEGAVMLSKLYRDPGHMYTVIAHLSDHIHRVVRIAPDHAAHTSSAP